MLLRKDPEYLNVYLTCVLRDSRKSEADLRVGFEVRFVHTGYNGIKFVVNNGKRLRGRVIVESGGAGFAALLRPGHRLSRGRERRYMHL